MIFKLLFLISLQNIPCAVADEVYHFQFQESKPNSEQTAPQYQSYQWSFSAGGILGIFIGSQNEVRPGGVFETTYRFNQSVLMQIFGGVVTSGAVYGVDFMVQSFSMRFNFSSENPADFAVFGLAGLSNFNILAGASLPLYLGFKVDLFIPTDFGFFVETRGGYPFIIVSAGFSYRLK